MKSYSDPRYDEIDKQVSEKIGLPEGLLASIRLNGERSNADQVSEAGARSVYQIIPSTRKAAIDKYGIDPYISPKNAAEVAGLLLKDSLDRNKGDISSAVSEYHGGTNKANWGAKTKAYAGRVLGGLVPSAQADELSLDDKLLAAMDSYKPAADDSDLLAKMDTYKPAKETSFLDKAKDLFTGNLRQTKETESLPDWATMPELNQLSIASAKTGLGTLLSNPEETAKIIQSNFPDAKIRQDEKGNYLITSPSDGKEYAIKPGFQVSDIPRAIGALAAFTPAGRAESIAGQVLGSAATQAGIEATQAGTGGDFNTGDVIAAGAIPAVIHGASGVLNPVFNKIKSLLPNSKPVIAENPAGVASSAIDAEQVLKQESQLTEPVIVTDKRPTQAEIDKFNAENPVQPNERVLPNQTTDAELGDTAKKAAMGTIGKEKAANELADQAAIDLDVQAAAKDLGFDLEADQMTTNDQFRRLVGLTRSQVGSDAEKRGIASIEQSAIRADEAMVELGANSKKDISMVSDKVKNSLSSIRKDLDGQSSAIYKKIDESVPNSTEIQLPNLQAKLDETIKELGGRVGSLNSQEARLYKLINSDEPITYLTLRREKDLIGKALAGKESPYGSMAEGDLKQLYGALSKDQADAVSTVGGEAMSDQLKLANQLVAKRKALEKRIVNAYGRDGDGSIVNLLRNSITSGSKGDVTNLDKVLKVIPPELQKEAIATSIANLASKGDKFSFNAYANLYRGLRKNSQVYNRVIKSLGSDSHEFMHKLYLVSNGIAKAQQAVLHTGKANQVFLGADTLTQNILRTAKEGGVKLAVGAAADTMGAGGFGMGAAVMSAINQAKTPPIKAVGDLLSSTEFKNLAIKAATSNTPDKILVKKLASSSKFNNFLKIINKPMSISEREKWIIQSLQATNESGN